MSTHQPASRPGQPLDQAVGPDGEALLLRPVPGGFELLSDGRVVIASAERRSERELVNVGLVPLRDRQDVTVLLGGLGMGFTLAALLDSARVVRVDVVEHCLPLIEWNRTHLAGLHRAPPLDDPRVRVHAMGFSDYLRAVRYQAVPERKLDGSGYLAVVLDLDDGPSALTRGRNADLYSDDGLVDMDDALRPGGVVALWSAQRELALMKRLQGRFQNIAEVAFPVDVPGGSLDYIYRARKRPPAVAVLLPSGNAQA